MITSTSTERASILLIYTGGTIGMKLDPVEQTLRPFDFSQIREEVPELGKFACRIDAISFTPIIDSSDVEPAMWQKLATTIEQEYGRYDGFVVLHGTDTMAFTASALSFMLSGLSKPVVLTGSQLPIGVPRTDGRENLISAVEIASAKGPDGRAMLPEVCICFDNIVCRGNRSTKLNSVTFQAFDSPNFPRLAEAGIEISYDTKAILPPPGPEEAFRADTRMDTRVSILKIHPGITPGVVRDILCGEDTRAVIIETYGSGNAPSRDWFVDLVREAAGQGKILVNVTQCPKGIVNMSLYRNGKILEDAGVVGCGDMTTECALAKLFHLMGRSADNAWVKRMMPLPLRGEVTRPA